jgi:hypothetical protein
MSSPSCMLEMNARRGESAGFTSSYNTIGGKRDASGTTAALVSRVGSGYSDRNADAKPNANICNIQQRERRIATQPQPKPMPI